MRGETCVRGMCVRTSRKLERVLVLQLFTQLTFDIELCISLVHSRWTESMQRVYFIYI
jgi:hypothetical protein